MWCARLMGVLCVSAWASMQMRSSEGEQRVYVTEALTAPGKPGAHHRRRREGAGVLPLHGTGQHSSDCIQDNTAAAIASKKSSRVQELVLELCSTAHPRDTSLEWAVLSLLAPLQGTRSQESCTAFLSASLESSVRAYLGPCPGIPWSLSGLVIVSVTEESVLEDSSTDQRCLLKPTGPPGHKKQCHTPTHPISLAA